MFKVVSHDMKEEWDTIINNSKQTDIYHEWGYVNSYKINGDGEPLYLHSLMMKLRLSMLC